MTNNWDAAQTKELFDTVFDAVERGQGLSSAFAQIASRHGRSLNSVRNFYYSQCKLFAILPSAATQLGIRLVESRREGFVTFSDDELNSLIEHILRERVSGKSVRKILAEYSNGDSVLALRYMNKYRSTLTTHKPRVLNIMASLRQRSVPYFNPYTNTVVTSSDSDSRTKLAAFLSKLEESELDKFIDIINKIVN